MRKLLLALALFPLLASAETLPVAGATDARVRKVSYNPNQVVRIPTFYGVSTHIQFEADEALVDVASGDDSAWEIKPRKTHLFIRPMLDQADTNLTVTTTKGRVYQFILEVQKLNDKDPSAWRDKGNIYSLSFTYPEVEEAKAQAAANKRLAADQQQEAEKRLAAAKQHGSNIDYWVAGNPDVSPTSVSDDGNFTRISFDRNRMMPAIYEEDFEGKEHLVPWNVEGNTIVLHRVYRKLILRKGNVVACLVNKGFSLDGGRDLDTGTVSSGVERVVKGGK
ncbi:P-type conjugative transfer protein VirB9 [Achromobacter spanius]|uniref:P-type conjugative transfer protein VirB9 n=1 Tax=Achromobacter spanius TaxID=217203 RepID=UPI0038033CD8